MDELIEQYVKLRDAKAKLKQKYAEPAEIIEKAMAEIENKLLRQFSEMGVESMRTAHGTAYRATRTSATVADWQQTLDYIKTHGMWEMLEKRVNKTVVEDFKNEYGDLPPGVNYREEWVINVRRS